MYSNLILVKLKGVNFQGLFLLPQSMYIYIQYNLESLGYNCIANAYHNFLIFNDPKSIIRTP